VKGWEKKAEELEKRYEELTELLSDPEMYEDKKRMQEVTREHAELKETVTLFRDYREKKKRLEEAREFLDGGDEEMEELARGEIEELEPEVEKLEKKIPRMLLPKDPNDDKNVIIEIRAGTGGDEAGLFAGDLFRMYTRYAEKKGWKVEILNSSEAEVGGFKEIIFTVSGNGAYSHFKFESGVHRVQRVPVTESGGRIHTSAATVAVLPEVEEVEIEIDPNELRIDTFRSSGPGGQSVNTTDSAVRITHEPTGLTVSCQDEKSQHKNRAKALKILRARLQDQMRQEQQEEMDEARKTQVGSGDRSERIRTYNFPQGRVTDHRINLTLHKLDDILEGHLEQIIEALLFEDEKKKMEKVGSFG